jgi:hypothetical protein
MLFRTVSQLGIRYRNSPAVQPARQPRRGPRRGPLPGDRLPDARVLRDGAEIWLQEALYGQAFHLLLCGQPTGWDEAAVDHLRTTHGSLLSVHRLVPGGAPARGHEKDLVDASGSARRRLRARRVTHLVVRPDGHIGYRADHADLTGARTYLGRWLSEPRTASSSTGPARASRQSE